MLPGVAFALRFGNEDGFVQQFFARQRDLVARELAGSARCLLVFKDLGNNPVYSPRWAKEAQANFYDFSPKNKKNIKHFVQENNIVLVVFQSADLGEINLRFFNKLRVRTISTEDSSFDDTRTQSSIHTVVKFLIRDVMKYGVHDLHIVTTQGQYDFLCRFACLPRERLRKVPYGIDAEYYHPSDRAEACARLGLNPSTIWIMAAAQSRPEKRVDFLLNIVKRVKEARPRMPVGFFYVGDGWMMEEWKALAQSLLPASDYRFFGKQTDMRTFYHAASVFIHGAFKESFGLVLVEAMASGLPVIGTRAHGPCEIISDGSTGYLIDRNDPDAFERALLSYIDHPELIQIHGATGRERCLEHYTCDREASELANLIRPFLGPPAQVTECARLSPDT